MSNDAGVAVLEVGGSHVTAAVVVPGSWQVEALRRTPLDSRTSAEEIVAQLGRAAAQLPLDHGLALALPGPFDYETGIAWYRGVEKFDSLYGHDLGKSLRDLLDLDRVVFVNDAEAFAVGEWTAGTLRGFDRCAGVTIGTGIGTAFLLNGRVVRTGDTVPPGGELYRTTYRGKPLEDWISARAILAAYGEAPGVKEVADAARAGDTRAHQVLLDAFTVLAETLTPWLDRFGATRVVLGGSISGAFDLVRQLFEFDVTVTQDTEHAAIIGTAARAID
ncbi:ROK family protein [Kribbella sp. ALI-6-A]|uniref:ROK family protein n=1 Tax=Kribbella sp. ALI-6-A TaxID=1933817 RepID=UPI00097C646B|nr:ROK family protein [Kribbella sp. ALI-6-A]ONI71668.1 ROK family protein [Kribbella sp. ALI-6-A]